MPSRIPVYRERQADQQAKKRSRDNKSYQYCGMRDLLQWVVHLKKIPLLPIMQTLQGIPRLVNAFQIFIRCLISDVLMIVIFRCHSASQCEILMGKASQPSIPCLSPFGCTKSCHAAGEVFPARIRYLMAADGSRPSEEAW